MSAAHSRAAVAGGGLRLGGSGRLRFERMVGHGRKALRLGRRQAVRRAFAGESVGLGRGG